MADDGLCIGDWICLYSEELYGFVFGLQSSLVHSDVAVSPRQHRLKPAVPDPQVFTFEVMVANRYKLNKKYRKLKNKADLDPDNPALKHYSLQAKIGADAENEDNITEQKRQLGKKVLYGQVIQLLHVFTGKYVHVSTTQTSKTESSNMQVAFQETNAKHAHFRIMPRYKVKAEGDIVQVDDQIVFESIKSGGQYLHVSKIPFPSTSVYSFSHELNLSVIQSGFTIYRRYKKSREHSNMLKAGELVRFFHKEIEAYLVAEGLFDDQITEDVHLRLRAVDQNNPKTMFPSSSAITYWQIEMLEGPTFGGVLRWEQQCRIKHMTTRMYMTVEKDGGIGLTSKHLEPKTVFKLHPVIKYLEPGDSRRTFEADEIGFDTYCRIEHVLSATWLHASTEEYKRKEFEGTSEDDTSMAGLQWTTAAFKKVTAVPEKQYDDAFTLQVVEEPNVRIFNYMAGMVPFVQKLIAEKKSDLLLDAKQAYDFINALREMKRFMIVNSVPDKNRQKLMRNLRIVELLVQLLKIPYRNTKDQHHLTSVFVEAYDVLYTYLKGDSRKNELYIAKHIPFFQTQIEYEGDIGLNAAHMTMELIKDNRKIVDRISNEEINHFVELLKRNKNHRYLDLLSVLCVCDGVSIPDNQTFITKVWLQEGKNCVYYTELGQVLNRPDDVVYVSTDNSRTWEPLHEFAKRTMTKAHLARNGRVGSVHPEELSLKHMTKFAEKAGDGWIEITVKKRNGSHEQFDFLEHQLDLFGKLCYGRNEHCIKVITAELKYLSWEEAYLCLTNSDLPDVLRAKYCDLIIALFVDIGENFSLLDIINLTFIYDDVGKNKKINRPLTAAAGKSGPSKNRVTSHAFTQLRDWITKFLDVNRDMTASLIGHNMLVEQVLRLISYLVRYGYYDQKDDINNLLGPLLDLLDGRNDKPYPNIKGVDGKEVLQYYRTKDRFKASPETKAIVDAKFRAMEVLDLFFNFRFNTRLEGFVLEFKNLYHQTQQSSSLQPELCPLLYDTFDLEDHSRVLPAAHRTIEKLFESTAVFEGFDLPGILKDLSCYEYNYMVTQSMKLLNRYFSSHDSLFKRAVQAQVLLTDESVSILYEVRKLMPTLRHLSTAKMSSEQTGTMIDVLQQLIKLCSLEDDPEERHPINQTILYNHGIIEDVFQILTQDVDIRLLEQYQGLKTVFRMSFNLLQVMARGNDLVQRRLFDRLDLILGVQSAEPQMAEALKEVFTGNKNCCMRILPSQVQKIMTLASKHLEKAPQFFDLLNAVVKVEELDLPLKRNQAYVMKYFMQYRSDMAYVIDQPADKRKELLANGQGDTLTYLIALVDMLATCAEGENQLIESICQTIFSIDELLEILTNPSINNNLKRPFLRFLLWVYLNTASGMIESGAGDLPHDSEMWKLMKSLPSELTALTSFCLKEETQVKQLLKRAPTKSDNLTASQVDLHHGTLHYLFEAAMPFLQVFFRSYYRPDQSKYPGEADHVDALATALVDFSKAIGPLVSNPTHMKVLVACVSSVMSASTLPVSVMEEFQNKYGAGSSQHEIKSDARKKYEDSFSGEEEINNTLNMFAINFSIGYGGENNVKAQTGFPSTAEYTEIGGDEELPLGAEFQQHIACFINYKAPFAHEVYKMAGKLVQQLSISHSRTNLSEKEKVDQEELDIKCLKILRGIIHNEIVKLPVDWETNTLTCTKQIQKIMTVITALNEQDAMLEILPHIAKQSDDIVREVLAFLVVILFAGHENVQDSLIDYFWGTREETFFYAIKNRMQLSAMAAKERRLLMAQHQAKVEEAISQAKALKKAMSDGQDISQHLLAHSTLGSVLLEAQKSKLSLQSGFKQRTSSTSKLKSKLAGFSQLGSRLNLSKPIMPMNGSTFGSSLAPPPPTNQKLPSNGSIELQQMEQKKVGSVVALKHSQVAPMSGPDIDIKIDTESVEDEKEEDMELQELAAMLMSQDTGDLEYRDDGYIELVLRLIGQMCDGQNTHIQDYIREQPDNIKSVNLVAETSKFLSIVYSNINNNSIGLVTQLFSTLNELTSGNSKNQVNVFDNKVCDYINHILRSSQYKGCSIKEILGLKKEIGYLIMSLIEENRGRPKDDGIKVYNVAKEVMETLDKDAIFGVMLQCYQESQRLQGKQAKSQAAQQLRQEAESVGFLYFHILCRMIDLDEEGLINKTGFQKSPLDVAIWSFYETSTLSVELLKDNTLQKVYFRVKDKNVLREEIKEKFKYNVDRSSPNDKIRDFMEWSVDIIKDIKYQQKIQANKFLQFFIMFSWWFNFFTLIVSFSICLMILVAYEAPKFSNGDYITNQTGATVPTSEFAGVDVVRYILSALHNFLSVCVFLSYMLSNRPTLPRALRKLLRRKSEDSGSVWMKQDEDRESHLEVGLLSFKTLYYLLFLVFSALGTAFYGYFFAFHLLHIASMNQLLSRVIGAVSKNGLSLVMVAILGLIFFYIYSVISFAFYRELYNTTSGLYCNRMYECFLTLIHHGLIENTYNYLIGEVQNKPFSYHVVLAIYNVTFFILVTTIGLNIIFGIIVDTFSELRDSKWQVDNDMNTVCFVCSRSSYDFDHHAGGFQKHVKKDHHQWSYLFFFMYLDNTRINDYRSIELTIFRQLLRKDFSFFPLHRALALQDDGDAKDAKVDSLIRQVNYLVNKMKEEEARKERERERIKQMEWKNTYISDSQEAKH